MFKKIFSDKSLIAAMLPLCTEEYKGRKPPPVEWIEEMDTERWTTGYGYVRLDLLFRVKAPDGSYFYFNVEGQNRFYPGYPLRKRILAYLHHIVLSEREQEAERQPEQSFYASFKKVYCLWIALYPPKKHQWCVKRYRWMESTEYDADKPKKLQEVSEASQAILVCLGDPHMLDWNQKKPRLLRFIGILLDPFLSEHERAGLLQEHFAYTLSREKGKELENMCDLIGTMAELVAEEMVEAKAKEMAEAKAKEMAEEKAEERKHIIDFLRSQNVDPLIIQKLQTATLV